MNSLHVAFWNYKEDQRHNVASETETHRANVAREEETKRYNTLWLAETNRHNVALETETTRHNRAYELETNRHNLVVETETERANRANEAIRWQANAIQAAYNNASIRLGREQLEYQKVRDQKQIQLDYQRLGEQRRHNVSSELAEIKRNEIMRSNYEGQLELGWARLDEDTRSHLANESLTSQRLANDYYVARERLRIDEAHYENMDYVAGGRLGVEVFTSTIQSIPIIGKLAGG